MEQDIRTTSLYREVCELYSRIRQPGTRQISDAAQLQASPDGSHVVFAATLAERVDEEPPTRIALTELATGMTRLLTSGPNTDKLPRFSPDGKQIAFLSDRRGTSSFQLYLLDRQTGAAWETHNVAGSVEHLQWSQDGTRVLLRVVGPGAQVENIPAWMPSVDPPEEDPERRGCWIYDVGSDSVRRVSSHDCNTWEASWCGNDALVAVASARPGEGYWYSAALCGIDLKSGQHRKIYYPADQLGPPVPSPAGKTVAIVEGLCSDRGPVAGDLRLIDLASGNCRTAGTHGVDVLSVQWHSEQYLLVSGIRGFESVVGLYDAASDLFTETWASQDVAVLKQSPSALQVPGDCVMITESFTHAPELVALRDGQRRRVTSFDVGYGGATAIAAVERVTWAADDELEIQGWLLRPRGAAPFPLVMDVHGGPVGQWAPACLARRSLHVPLLLEHGFAVFLPNPRGSTGRGQTFARKVMGDLGGADARDLLHGLDALIERGVVDSRRIGVTGASYGGFMAAWLVTQSARFAAAVAVSPHTNQLTAGLLSDIPQFMARLVGAGYFERSPVFHAARARTPTLNICGALDRCTPPEEAVQFHNALLQNGTRSVLVSYPQAGHGIRKLPAMLDCATRIGAWLLEHIPATTS